MMHALDELFLLLMHNNVTRVDFLIFHTPHFLHSAFSALRIIYTPHFLHSSFSALRIFYTPHFPHSAFSTLLIFYTPHFPHSALRTLRFPPNLVGVNTCEYTSTKNVKNVKFLCKDVTCCDMVKASSF